MARPVLPDDDAVLTAREAGARLHLSPSRFRALSNAEPMLRAAKRYRGRRAFWTLGGVVRFINYGMSAAPQGEPSVPPSREKASVPS